jgi:hypothetical protein
VKQNRGPAAGIAEEHTDGPRLGVPKEAGADAAPIKASVTGLMILTALSAGCAKKEDRAAQAATRAETGRGASRERGAPGRI